MLASLAPRLRRTLAILGKVTRIVRCSTAAVAMRATLAASLRRTLAVLGEVARAALSTNTSGTGRLLPILGKVTGIAGMSLFRHAKLSNEAYGMSPGWRRNESEAAEVVFTIPVIGRRAHRTLAAAVRGRASRHTTDHLKQLRRLSSSARHRPQRVARGGMVPRAR